MWGFRGSPAKQPSSGNKTLSSSTSSSLSSSSNTNILPKPLLTTSSTTTPTSLPSTDEYHVDVNASFVVENPREHSTFYDILQFTTKKQRSVAVPLQVLPDITRRDFYDYLNQLRIARKNAGLDPNAELSLDDGDDIFNQIDGIPLSSSSSSSTSSSSSSSSFSSTPADSTSNNGTNFSSYAATSNGTVRNINEINAFVTVPSAYFDPNFSLKQNNMFETVLNTGQTLDDVHDNLTNQLDTIECHLLTEIRARSRQFFEALSQLHEFRDRVVDASVSSKVLTRHLDRLKQENCIQPLSTIVLARRRERRIQVLALLHEMREATTAPLHVARLYNTGDLMGALDVIDHGRKLLNGKLHSIKSMSDVHKKLNHFEISIANDFVDQYTRSAVMIATVGSHNNALPLPNIGKSESNLLSSSFSTTTNSSSLSSILFAGNSTVTSTMDTDYEYELTQILQPLLIGLLRVKRVADALDNFQGILIKEIIEVLRTDTSEAIRTAELSHVASPSLIQESSAQQDDNKHISSQDSSMLADSPDRLQALSPQAFIDVLQSFAKHSISILNRVGALHDLVERTLDTYSSTTNNNGSFASSTTNTTIQTVEMKVSLQRLRAISCGQVAVAVDTIQRRYAALLSSRREQSARMKVAEMRILWDTVISFNNGCNMVLTRAGVSNDMILTGSETGHSLSTSTVRNNPFMDSASSSSVTDMGKFSLPSLPSSIDHTITRSLDEVMYHAKAMLHYVHTRNTSALTALLDTELWKQADVPRQVQNVADALSAAVSAAPSSGIIQKATAAASGINTSQEEVDGNIPHTIAGLPPNKSLTANGQNFIVVGTGIMLVKMLGDYASITEAIPDLATEVIQCIVQLLRQFNTRTTQLVLGAEAIKVTTLKRITAKHLAVTSQTLSAVLALLPSIRAILLIRLPPNQHILLSDLANITTDILAHDNRIRAKFVAIVKDLVIKCLNDLRKLPWGDSEATLPLPTPPMIELTTGISTLYRILRSVFRVDQLADIFARILVMLNAQLPGQCAALISFLVMEAQQALAAQVTGQTNKSSIPTSTRFSRDVATKRLAVDLRSFLSEMQSLADSCLQIDDDSNSSTKVESIASSSFTSTNVNQILAPGTDALHAMRTWVTQQYGSEDILLSTATSSQSSSVGTLGDNVDNVTATPTIDSTPVVESTVHITPSSDSSSGSSSSTVVVDTNHHINGILVLDEITAQIPSNDGNEVTTVLLTDTIANHSGTDHTNEDNDEIGGEHMGIEDDGGEEETLNVAETTEEGQT